MTNISEPTTFSFDQETRQRLRDLAALWQVSQVEVVRRALARAEEAEKLATDPAAALLAYHAQGGLDSEKARGYLESLSRDRSD